VRKKIILKTYLSPHLFLCEHCDAYYEQVVEVDGVDYCGDCFDEFMKSQEEDLDIDENKRWKVYGERGDDLAYHIEQDLKYIRDRERGGY